MLNICYPGCSASNHLSTEPLSPPTEEHPREGRQGVLGPLGMTQLLATMMSQQRITSMTSERDQATQNSSMMGVGGSDKTLPLARKVMVAKEGRVIFLLG